MGGGLRGAVREVGRRGCVINTDSVHSEICIHTYYIHQVITISFSQERKHLDTATALAFHRPLAPGLHGDRRKSALAEHPNRAEDSDVGAGVGLSRYRVVAGLDVAHALQAAHAFPLYCACMQRRI